MCASGQGPRPQIIIPDARYRDDLRRLFGSLFRRLKHPIKFAERLCFVCASSGLIAVRQLSIRKTLMHQGSARYPIDPKTPSV